MNILNLYQLRDKLSDIAYCNITTSQINHILYGDRELNEIYLVEEYENYRNLDYVSFVIYKINKILYKVGVVTIEIRNSSGSDATLIHEFVLFMIDDHYYRMESYGKTSYIIVKNKPKTIYESLYTTRIVEWPTYDFDLIKLLNINKGYERLLYWNGLFSANEKYDNDFDLDIKLVYT